LFGFLPNIHLWKFCYFISVSSSNLLWYCISAMEPNRRCVVLHNAICVLFNTKEFHKMATPINIKIVIVQPSLCLCHWLSKKIETSNLFCYIYSKQTHNFCVVSIPLNKLLNLLSPKPQGNTSTFIGK
jgi:hypothetical protein